MSTYKYLGLTTYIREDHYTKEAVNVLAEALHTLNGATNTPVELLDYDFVTESEAFKRLYAQTNSVSPNGNMPQNAPVGYDTPQVDYVTIKGYKLVRIYVPAVSEDEDLLYQYSLCDLTAVMDMLFGGDIINMKSRECDEYHEFDAAHESILISAPQPRKQPMPQSA